MIVANHGIRYFRFLALNTNSGMPNTVGNSSSY